MVDANGTRHHLLLGQADWERCSGYGTTWDPERVEVTLQPRIFEFVAAPRDEAPDLSSRRGGARDRYGNWYWIAPSQVEILVNSSGSGNTRHYWASSDEILSATRAELGDFQRVAAAPPAPLVLSGLTITEDHYLVVGVLNPPGLLVFDLFASGGPIQIGWPRELVFNPFDMAPRPGGGVWILDRTNKRYWGLDRRLNLLAGAMEGVPLSIVDPIAIEALPDGTIMILDPASIYRYRAAEQIGESVPTDIVRSLIDLSSQSEIRLAGYDFAFEPTSSRLYIVSSTGNQAFAFFAAFSTDQLVLTPLPLFLPMRLFAGKGIEVGGGQPYYDFADRWIPLIEQRRPRFVTQGVIESPVLDGRDPDCVWHRLMLDACIPDQTTVVVATRAANDTTELSLTDWQPEPRPYLRGNGTEQPFVPGRQADGAGTWELLFQQARGRYAQVQLTLLGNGRSTPRLHALRAYYPRFSYLEHYLPGVYRAEATSAAFLDRFLANTEGFYTALEDKIASVEVLFDARSAPADVLDWLTSWLGAVRDPAWDERRQRLFIEHAPELYQYRGTLRGIQMGLQLVLGTWTDDAIFDESVYRCELVSNIRVIEQFRTRQASSAALGDPTSIGATAPDTMPAEGIVDAWRDFVARRYRRVSALNQAYATAWQSFDQVPLPDAGSPIPAGAQAADWNQFNAIVLRMRNAAHRFSVIMPISKQTQGNSDAHNQVRDLATRVVNLEKPAHTIFDVRFYWALFRVGGVRLGIDTVLDQGSRAAQLLPPLVLKGGYLSEGYLAPAFPQDVTDRTILGRDALTASALLRPGGC